MTDNSPKESFVHWQSITISQLTYAVNLILGLSVATLAFQVTVFLNEKLNPTSCGQKFTFFLALLALLASAGIGIWCIINRLRDFRATTKAARMREQGKSDTEIKPYRDLYEKLGEKTWLLFWWQIGTFSAGVLFTVLSILASVSHKLL
jgi:hypothetical protein